MIILGIIVVAVLLIVFFISVSNNVNRAIVKIDEAKSGVEIQLKKRYDVLTQSADIVKNFTKHEEEVFTSLRKCNSNMSVEEINEINQEQNKAMTKLFALGEAYPELKSSNLYSNLQAQLSEENAQFAASKRAFNSNVTKLNNLIVSFPSSVVCSMKGQSKMDFIKEDNVEQMQNVNLGF